MRATIDTKGTPSLRKLVVENARALGAALFLRSGEVEALRQKGSLLTVLIFGIHLLD
ncbi:MAG: hypothetical protein LZF62_230110 [Nitrospira sp.]|nr:MAG: hypothetical protein LZF62_230110 [Nitrospira sp.]